MGSNLALLDIACTVVKERGEDGYSGNVFFRMFEKNNLMKELILTSLLFVLGFYSIGQNNYIPELPFSYALEIMNTGYLEEDSAFDQTEDFFKTESILRNMLKLELGVKYTFK